MHLFLAFCFFFHKFVCIFVCMRKCILNADFATIFHWRQRNMFWKMLKCETKRERKKQSNKASRKLKCFFICVRKRVCLFVSTNQMNFFAGTEYRWHVNTFHHYNRQQSPKYKYIVTEWHRPSVETFITIKKNHREHE